VSVDGGDGAGPVVRPVVAVSCYLEPASWGVWQQVPAVLVPAAYVVALRAAGARVVLLPPEEGLSEQDALALLSGVDGLVLAGGADVGPGRYGAGSHPLTQRPRDDRDESEIALVRAAIAADLPVLGICRGMQVMAVAEGGDLNQHLPDLVGHHGHSPIPDGYGMHDVVLAEGSWLRGVLGERVQVPTHHHQGVRTHPGLTATGWAEDGVVEALEAPGARLRVGVQWHPEVGTDPRLFSGFVAALR
jgi:putative glutamine amidotransferase